MKTFIDDKQKGLIHKYAKLARLSRAEYEGLLTETARVETSCRLDQVGFDLIMPVLEAILWDRIDAGIVPDPHVRGAHIERFHWRNKAPKEGMADSRHCHKIKVLWGLLMDYLPETARNDAYLAGIISKVSGINRHDLLGADATIAWEKVPNNAARLAIEAIKDRLTYSVRRAA